jgi:uncharacterized protein YuzE
MKTKEKHILLFRSDGLITVEVDTEAGAAYIRFAEGKVAKTVVHDESDVLITFDLDKTGRVLGAEFVGVEEFTLTSLLAKLPSSENAPRGEVRYVSARKLQEA